MIIFYENEWFFESDFLESVLKTAKDTCCNLQCDGMVHSIPTSTPPLMAIVLSKWVWGSLLDKGLHDIDNWNSTQPGQVNTKGPLNSSSEDMGVHVVLMGVQNSKTLTELCISHEIWKHIPWNMNTVYPMKHEHSTSHEIWTQYITWNMNTLYPMKYEHSISHETWTQYIPWNMNTVYPM